MKNILLIVIISLFSTTLFSQVSSPISLGLHGGLVSTKFESKSGNDLNADNGMMLGAFARINIKKWYIQPELNYVKRKSSFQKSLIGANIFPTIETKSIDIPVLLGYKIVKLPMFKLRAFAGPVASFNIDDNYSSTFIEDANFKSTVWNAKFGAGIDVWKFTLDLDYEVGLSDVAKDLKGNMVNVTIGFCIL